MPELLRRQLTAADHARFGGARRPDRPARIGPDEGERSAQSVLVVHDWGKQEIERMLRSIAPAALGSPVVRDTYRALVQAAVAAEGGTAVLGRWLDRERRGRTGKVDQGQLAALLDGALADAAAGGSIGTPEQLHACLQALSANLNPQDATQLRRLARLQVLAGDQGRASILFQWCALVRGGMLRAARGEDDLLSEVVQSLSGTHRTEAVAGILSLGQPGTVVNEAHVTRVLETWMDLLEPADVLARSRGTLAQARDLSRRPMRQACKLAALIHARGGEAEAAMQCLKIALCRIEFPATHQIPTYQRYFSMTGGISTYEIARLFPKGMADFADPDTWLTTATNSVLTWIDEKRLDPALQTELLAVLALRLHERGRVDEVEALLPKLHEVAGDVPGQLLWVADVARFTGAAALGDRIETELLEAGRLHIERVPRLVARVIESAGPAAGLALGEKAAQLTLHAELLTHLIAAAGAAGEPERAAHWERVRAEAEAAAAKLRG